VVDTVALGKLYPRVLLLSAVTYYSSNALYLFVYRPQYQGCLTVLLYPHPTPDTTISGQNLQFLRSLLDKFLVQIIY